MVTTVDANSGFRQDPVPDGSGYDWFSENVHDDHMRFWRKGEPYPRIAIVAATGEIFVGNGLAYPTVPIVIIPSGINAVDIAFEPDGSIASTNVQAAIQEVRDEAATMIGSGSVPPGGTTDQALLKTSNVDGDAGWRTLTAALVGAAADFALTAELSARANADIALQAAIDAIVVGGGTGDMLLADALFGIDATAARTNLELGGAAILDVGIDANSVAAGDAPQLAVEAIPDVDYDSTLIPDDPDLVADFHTDAGVTKLRGGRLASFDSSGGLSLVRRPPGTRMGLPLRAFRLALGNRETTLASEVAIGDSLGQLWTTDAENKIWPALYEAAMAASFNTIARSAGYMNIDTPAGFPFPRLIHWDTVAGIQTSVIKPLVVTDPATEKFLLVAHGYVNGTPISFSGLTATTGISNYTRYFVVSASADDFKVSATPGGAVLPLGGTTDTLTASSIGGIWGRALSAGQVCEVTRDGDGVTIFYGAQRTLGDTVTVQINGATVGTINSTDATVALSPGYDCGRSVSYANPDGYGPMTVTVTDTSGSGTFLLDACYIAAGNLDSGYQLHQLIHGGWGFTEFLDPLHPHALQHIKNQLPQLVTIFLGLNDSNNFADVAGFATLLEQMIAAVRAQYGVNPLPSIRFVFEPSVEPGSIAPLTWGTEYRAAARLVCEVDGDVGFVDWFEVLGTYAGGDDPYQIAPIDGVHPGDPGHFALAQSMMDATLGGGAAAVSTALLDPYIGLTRATLTGQPALYMSDGTILGRRYLVRSGDGSEWGLVGPGLTASILAKASTKTADYTFALADGGRVIHYNNTTPGAFTVPSNLSVPHPIGTRLGGFCAGTGDLTIAPGVIAPVAGLATNVSANTFALTAHGYVDGTPVSFTGLSNTTGISNSTTYYIVNAAANTFKVALTVGGAAIDLTGTADTNVSVTTHGGFVNLVVPPFLSLVLGQQNASITFRKSAIDTWIVETGSDFAALAAGILAFADASLNRTAVKTGAYSVLAGQLVPVDTTGGDVTITLPTAPANGTRVGIAHIIQGGQNTVTFTCGGSDVLNKAAGSTFGVLVIPGVLTLEYDSASAIWTIDASYYSTADLDIRYLVSRATFSNANATIVTGTTLLAQIGTMSASRTATLPAASSLRAGARLTVVDESGTVTATNTIIIGRAGADTVNGGLFALIATAYGAVVLISDGVSKWTTTDNAAVKKASNLGDLLSADTSLTNLGATAFGKVTILGARATFSNAVATIAAPTVVLAQIGTMSASRTVTLPAASAYAAGTSVTVIDESGTVTGTFTIIVARAGADTLNGSTFGVIATAYGALTLISDGVSKWTTTDNTRLAKASNLGDLATPDTGLTNLGITTLAKVAAKGTRTTFSNAAATIAAPTIIEAQIGTMSASRVVTLPAASAYAAGGQITILDESGTVTAAFTLVLTCAGSDTFFNTGQTTEIIGVPGGYRTIASDGVSKWVVLARDPVLPTNLWHPGILASTAADDAAASSSHQCTAAVQHFFRVPLPRPIVIANINYELAVAATVNTNGYIAWYDSGGTMRAQSADLSTPWQTTGGKTTALSYTPVWTGPDAFGWIMFYTGTATTPPSVRSGNVVALLNNIGMSTSALRCGTIALANTATMPNVTPSNMVSATGTAIVHIT